MPPEAIILLLVPLGLIGAILWGVSDTPLDSSITLLVLLIGIPIGIAITILYLGYRIVAGVLYLLWALSIAVLKSVIFGFVAVVSTGIALVSYPVTGVGNAVQRINRRLDHFVQSSAWADDKEYTRDMMVEIIVEVDERDLLYEDPTKYREKLKEVKGQRITKLTTGESTLSILIGGVLLISQINDIPLFRAEIYGTTAAQSIQVSLFLIAVSVIYRTTLLDHLAYSGNEEFSSLAEMDVALSYQKAISFVKPLSNLVFLMVFAMRLVSADRGLVKKVLRLYYTDKTLIEALNAGWEEWKERNDDSD